MWPIKRKIPFIEVFLFFCFFCFASQSFASSYFLESSDAAETPTEISQGLVFGAHVGGFYYIKGIEAMLEGTLQYRLHKNHAAGVFFSFSFPESQIDLGADYRLYLFSSFSNLSEDFLHLGISGTYFEKFKKSYWVPKLSLSYGKDVKIVKKTPFALRFSIGGSYLFGEPLARKNNSFSVQESHMVLYVKTGVLFF